MKTYQQWQGSGIDLSKFLQPCDEVDEEIYEHQAGVVFPQYNSARLLQVGEAEREERGVMHYASFMVREDGRFFYLGILPKFKQPK